MKDRRIRSITAALALVVMLFNLVFFCIDSFFYNINNLPEGKFLFSSMSPGGQYTLKLYLVDGGQTLGKGIRGELVDIETKKSKNVYWVAGEEHAMVGWASDEVVSVNGHTVDVSKYVYDWRRELSPNVIKF